MNVLQNIKPKNVFKYFEEISGIPRGSGNEEGIARYCVNFANDRGLWSYRDKLNNVLIKKSGTKGREEEAPLIIQGHLDMVCEKNSDIAHDFNNEGIKLIFDGDDIKADGTTLGADNGIAVAMMLAVLDGDAPSHPPIECLFTSMEEVGLEGAAGFDYTKLSGSRLINLDSEEFGKLLVSCAGGVKLEVELPVEWLNSQLENRETYSVKIKGLKGGHSGADIHLGRANANKLLGRLLFYLRGKLDYELCSVNGGAKDNAIPREACAVINVNKADICRLEELIEAYGQIVEKEYIIKESGITVSGATETPTVKVFGKQTAEKAIGVIMSSPNGVMAMSAEISGLVETSVNLGVITTLDAVVNFSFAARSALETANEYVEEVIQNIASLTGAKFTASSRYPGWSYSPQSVLRAKAVEAFKSLEDSELQLDAIHAGLECGIFAEKIKDADIISFGPDMWDVHTPDERLSVSSSEKTYNLLLKILEII